MICAVSIETTFCAVLSWGWWLIFDLLALKGRAAKSHKESELCNSAFQEFPFCKFDPLFCSLCSCGPVHSCSFNTNCSRFHFLLQFEFLDTVLEQTIAVRVPTFIFFVIQPYIMHKSRKVSICWIRNFVHPKLPRHYSQTNFEIRNY